MMRFLKFFPSIHMPFGWKLLRQTAIIKNQIAIVFVDFASITLLYFKDIDKDISTNTRLHFHSFIIIFK